MRHRWSDPRCSQLAICSSDSTQRSRRICSETRGDTLANQSLARALHARVNKRKHTVASEKKRFSISARRWSCALAILSARALTGDPNSSSPFGGPLSPVNIFGLSSSHTTISLIVFFANSNPAKSAHLTPGREALGTELKA